MSSAQASGSNTPRNASTATQLLNNQISLQDHTRPQDEGHPEGSDDLAELSGRETEPSIPSSEFPLKKKYTRDSLQQALIRRKYARYGESRYIENAEDTEQQIGDEATQEQKGYLERGRAAAKGLIPGRKKKHHHQQSQEDAVMDILYENQRGAFLFGVPLFSSSSLLNFDPKAWLNANMRTSPVDITNAQVPDPSWEWAWKNWYVDMSRDVDEEGWEYSFSFGGRIHCAWHGTHPWFHSFVRRRRWLRKRERKHASAKNKQSMDSHMLTADYFTIHANRARSPDSSRNTSLRTASLARLKMRMEDEEPIAQQDIPDITTLLRILRKAAVDREKLVAVRKFVADGGDELYYLADQMPHIMSLFIFQSSRRQLLADLMQHFDSATSRRESLAEHDHADDEDARKEHEAAHRQAESLLNAVRAADDQVKRLEYWSDIKGMAHKGETLGATDENNNWDPKKWQGLDPSGAVAVGDAFAAKQPAHVKAHEPHKHPEHSADDDGVDRNRHGVDATDENEQPARKSSVQFQDAKESSEDTGFTTAAETPSEAASKPDKGKQRTL